MTTENERRAKYLMQFVMFLQGFIVAITAIQFVLIAPRELTYSVLMFGLVVLLYLLGRVITERSWPWIAGVAAAILLAIAFPAFLQTPPDPVQLLLLILILLLPKG